MQAWIFFTLLAASLQSVRTAGQKSLTAHVSPFTATAIRYFYGLPFVLLYVAALSYLHWPEVSSQVETVLYNGRFFAFTLAAGVTQILATVALLRVFAFRNFAVGTSLAKTEAIQIAVFGTLIFDEGLGLAAWLAVMIGVVGTLVVGGAFTRRRRMSGKVVALGILSGALFAFTSLFVRQAALSLFLPPLYAAAVALVFMVLVQSTLCASYLFLREPGEWSRLAAVQPAAWFVGITSAFGSVGWFTAMTLQNPALVKTLAQVEFLVTVLITHFYFRERIARYEWLGMTAIVMSVLLVLLW